MARLPTVDIPSADSLRPINFSGEKKLLKIDVSKVGSGAIYGGKQLQQLGQQITKQEEEEADYELSSATVDLMSASNQIVDEDDKNPEYKGSSERVTESYKKRVEEIGKNLSPKQRRLFELRAKEVEGKTVQKTAANAFKKEVETERSKVSNRLNELRELAYTDKDNVPVYANIMVELLNNSAKKGIYGMDDVQKMGEAWKADTFTKIINTMKPEDARAALDSPLATLIPQTEIDRLKLEADEKVGDNQAGNYVAANYKGSMTRLMKQMDKDGLNDSMRTKVMHQANLVTAAADNDRERSEKQAYYDVSAMKESGKTLKEIEDSDAFKRLHPDKKDNFRKSQSPERPDITPIELKKRLNMAERELGKGNTEPMEYLYSTSSAYMSKADNEYASDLLAGKKTPKDDATTEGIAKNRFGKNKNRAAQFWAAVQKVESDSGTPMTTKQKLDMADEIIMQDLSGSTPDYIRLSGAMYSGWQGGSTKQRHETGVKFDNLASQIGKDMVNETDSVTNAKALGRVMEWKESQTGKNLSDEDVQKRYKAEVQYSDYEEYLTLTDYADVRATFDRIDSVIGEDFEPEDRQKIFNELRKVHKDAAYSLFLRGDSPRNVKAYGELLQSGAGRATTLQKYLKKAK